MSNMLKRSFLALCVFSSLVYAAGVFGPRYVFRVSLVGNGSYLCEYKMKNLQTGQIVNAGTAIVFMGTTPSASKCPS
jgi:hypothetical protein